jgi:dTDP-4-dehydrorhamnose 3,5-epimerase
MSVFIPAGVANGFQTTSTNTTYSYLVDGHWSAGIAYQAVHAFDSDLAIPWPLPFSKSTMSSKDSSLESLSQCLAVADRSVILLGSRGQVGKALLKQFPDAITPSRNELMEAFDRGALEDLVPTGGIILNAAAMTNVDECETIEGYKEAIRVNYHLVQRLAEAANSKHATLVHFSTDYVFDGEKDSPYTETDLPNPINNYGMSKLLGDLGAQTAKRHYIFRTSWVYGDGKNFVRTMAAKATLGESVGVVSNQIGRPTRADSLALAVARHLHLNTPFGLYNFTDSGDKTSWHEMAVAAYEELLVDPIQVKDTGGGIWVSSDPPVARRPSNSMLSQDKTNREAGQVSQNWKIEIKEYLAFPD